MKREFLQNLTVGDQPLPKEVIDAIMEEHGKSIQKGKLWQEKYEQAVQEHEIALQQVRFEHLLETAITKAGGRNAKAITALLDVAKPAKLPTPLMLFKIPELNICRRNRNLFPAKTALTTDISMPPSKHGKRL